MILVSQDNIAGVFKSNIGREPRKQKSRNIPRGHKPSSGSRIGESSWPVESQDSFAPYDICNIWDVAYVKRCMISVRKQHILGIFREGGNLGKKETRLIFQEIMYGMVNLEVFEMAL